MRLTPGTSAPAVVLPGIDDQIFDTSSLRGRRYLLSFFRFAGCPLCNMRVRGLTQRYADYGSSFEVVAIFDSPPENLKRHTQRHQAPFPILADEQNTFYRQYGVERSLLGVAKGLCLRGPTFLKATLLGFTPRTVQGAMTTMPADFLIDEQGVIHTAFYARDEGAHLPFDQILAFAGGAN